LGRIQIVGINTTTATPISVVGMTMINADTIGFYLAYDDTEATNGDLMRRFYVHPTQQQPLTFNAGEGYTLWLLADPTAVDGTITVWTDIEQGSITGGY
jgi:hypothetical protein